MAAGKPNILIAAVLAWFVPGAGHYYLGRRFRAAVIFIVLSGLFWGGVAIGGTMTVDKRGERWWFIAQVNTGIHGLIGWYRSNRVYQEIESELARKPVIADPYSRPDARHAQAVLQALRNRGIVLVSPTAPVAYVYSGVAGLLNLLVVFDAFMLAAMGRRGEPDPQTDPEDSCRGPDA